ncbi:ArsR/SmtB family transcription factor [Alkalicoccus halolimnae]|uniref:Metalloregulator ArsR/SmtB family transcription factor n=1 Tax=Alkalicoccus halolimnae TaxID=1667239 RepID=A0A5C7FIH4_9BACI|nr:metalloregulator ArsR/SmtB family transcription factor [Alkalicoccus halolimnae]TXF85286.1 helix-turn-helix transcriptional regulator [Alkalicoccus halolimnae]
MDLHVHVSEAVDLTAFMFSIHNMGRKEDQELIERMLQDDEVEKKLKEIRRGLSAEDHEKLDVFFNEDSSIAPALLPAVMKGHPSLTAEGLMNRLRSMEEKEVRRHLFGRGFADNKYDGLDPKAGKRFVDKLAVPKQEKWKLYYYMDRPEAVNEELAALIEHVYHSFYKPFQQEAADAAQAFAEELRAAPNDPEHPVRRLVRDYMDTETIEGIHVYPSYSLNIGFMLQDLSEENAVHLAIGLKRFSLMESKMNEEELFGLLKVLTDERRFRLLKLLRKRPHYGYEIAEALGVSNSTVSHHLAILLSHKFVKSERAEHRVYYKVNTEEIKRVMGQMERMFAE